MVPSLMVPRCAELQKHAPFRGFATEQVARRTQPL